MTSEAPAFQLSLHPSIVCWRLPWPELGELARQTGYNGAVLPRNQPAAPEAATAVAGVAVTSMMLPVEVRSDHAAYEETLSSLRPACALAAALGCKLSSVSFPPSSELPKPEQAELYKRRLQPVCEVLEEYSIRLAFECVTPLHLRRPHPYEFICRFDEMLEFALTISPAAGLLLDSWHWHHGGARLSDLEQLPADRMLDVHLADSAPLPPEDVRDLERLLPGEGVVSLAAFLCVLRDKGYSGAISPEIFGRGLDRMQPVEAAALAYKACAETIRLIR
jgi:sugar phosphate isomerase/epimerase